MRMAYGGIGRRRRRACGLKPGKEVSRGNERGRTFRTFSGMLRRMNNTEIDDCLRRNRSICLSGKDD